MSSCGAGRPARPPPRTCCCCRHHLPQRRPPPGPAARWVRGAPRPPPPPRGAWGSGWLWAPGAAAVAAPVPRSRGPTACLARRPPCSAAWRSPPRRPSSTSSQRRASSAGAAVRNRGAPGRRLGEQRRRPPRCWTRWSLWTCRAWPPGGTRTTTPGMAELRSLPRDPGL